jgi:pyruvate dehydrogenase E1 component alpha subunit/2-oxoisovalerate dehydrogenase E1 component alpha subunit
VRGHKLDGTDPQVCLDVVGEAVARARIGEGPQLVVADLLRLAGHGEHDDAHYVNHALKVSPIGRDCLDVARAQMLAAGWVTPGQLDSMRDQAQAEVDSAYATALREPLPDPGLEDWRVLATSSLAEGTH